MTTAKRAKPKARAARRASVDDAPRFDVWVCEGRMCKSFGAEALLPCAAHIVAERGAEDRCRVLRGGCFGLCELAANVVVRRHASDERLPSPDEDRLSLTHRDNEVVYSQVSPNALAEIVGGHLDDDRVDARYTQAAREEAIGPRSTIAERMRALRERRRRRDA